MMIELMTKVICDVTCMANMAKLPAYLRLPHSDDPIQTRPPPVVGSPRR